MLPESNCWGLGNEKENPKKGGEIFRHRLPSLFCANGYANLGRRFLLSTNANLREKIMEFIRKINKTETVTVERMVPHYYKQEQTREVFVVELSRQEVEDLLAVYGGGNTRNYGWCEVLAERMEFVLDLQKNLYPRS